VSASEQTAEAELVSFKQDQFGDLKLHELISWSVQEEFSDNPFNGWSQALNCAIPTKTLRTEQKEAHQEHPEQRSQQAQPSIQKLIEETSDKIIIEKLLQ
jgi:hypothetical protein